jgi:hypothetical protein
VLSLGRCACRCSRASSPHRARRCRSPAPSTTPTHCSGTTGLSASRPARPPRPAAASPSGPSAGSTASGRRSPGSCWASPATTRSRRVSRPPTPSSTASPVIGLRQIHSNEPSQRQLRPQASDHGCPPMYADPHARSKDAAVTGTLGIELITRNHHTAENPGVEHYGRWPPLPSRAVSTCARTTTAGGLRRDASRLPSAPVRPAMGRSDPSSPPILEVLDGPHEVCEADPCVALRFGDSSRGRLARIVPSYRSNKKATCWPFVKPSDGLEPSTPP